MFNANRAVWDWLKAEVEGHARYPYTHPHKALTFGNSDEMIRRVTSSGSHYFTPDTVRCWKSRWYELVSGRFLITSDRHPNGRIYRVAYATDPHGATMISMERSPHMASLSQARAFARELVTVLRATGDVDMLTRRVLKQIDLEGAWGAAK